MADEKDKKEKREKAEKPQGKPGAAPKGGGKGKGKAEGKAEAGDSGVLPKVPVRLRERYRTEIAPRLKEKLSIGNSMDVPRVTRVTVNVGVGDARENAKHMEKAVEELRDITGQKPVVTKARLSISNFKIRKGMTIGCYVTLRGPKMWAFLDKLLSISLPRVRDFRGVSPNAFDGRGNYNLGIREQVIFPEINPDKVEKVRGMNITIATSAKNDVEARELLTELGMPFRK